jgi:hypothetical protein
MPKQLKKGFATPKLKNAKAKGPQKSRARLAQAKRLYHGSEPRPVSARSVPDKKKKRPARRDPIKFIGPQLLASASSSDEKRLGNSSGREGVSSLRMTNTKNTFRKTFRHTDRVFVQTITLPSTPVPGLIIWARRNLVAITGTYLEVEALQWSRWRPIRYRYVFVASPGSTFSGMIIGATDPDPTSTYVDNATNIQRLSILGGEMQQLNRGLKFDHPGLRDGEKLWVNDLNPSIVDFTDRFSSAGNSMLAVVTPGDMVSGQTVGAIFLEYDIEFSDPVLSTALTVGTDSATLSNVYSSMVTAGGINPINYALGLLVNTAYGYIMAAAIPNLVNAFFDWVPFVGGFELDGGDEPIKLGYVRGKLGASGNEQPGLRPGRYGVVFTFATNQEIVLDPYNGSYAGPFDLGSSGMISGGDITFLKTCPSFPFWRSSSVANLTSTKINTPDGGRKNWLQVELDYSVGTGRGFADFQLASNVAFVAGESDLYYLSFTSKTASQFVDGLGSGRERIRKFHPYVETVDAKGLPPVVHPDVDDSLRAYHRLRDSRTRSRQGSGVGAAAPAAPPPSPVSVVAGRKHLSIGLTESKGSPDDDGEVIDPSPPRYQPSDSLRVGGISADKALSHPADRSLRDPFVRSTGFGSAAAGRL